MDYIPSWYTGVRDPDDAELMPLSNAKLTKLHGTLSARAETDEVALNRISASILMAELHPHRRTIAKELRQ